MKADIDGFIADFNRLVEAQPDFFDAGDMSLWKPTGKRLGYETQPGDIDLENLESDDPGNGWGEAGMSLLAALADRHGVTIFLQAHSTFQDEDTPEDDEDYDADFDDSQGRLIGFYARHGFVVLHDQGATADMQRKPGPPQAERQAALDRALGGEPIEWPGKARRPVP